MQKRKERAFKEHRELIACLYYAGKGLMFRKHLVRYFTLQGHREKAVDEAIRDLIASDLVETVRFGNSHVLKLKKYSIYTLLEKEPEKVDSVRLTTTKIRRSAFLNERILLDIAQQPSRYFPNGNNELAKRLSYTTYASFEKRGYEFLQRVATQEKIREVKVLRPSAMYEISDLRKIYQFSMTGEGGACVRSSRARRESLQGINLNGLQSRDVYMMIRKGEGKGYLLTVDFLDLRSRMTEKQLREKIKMALPYLQSLFSEHVHLQVNVLVANEARAAYFASRSDRIVQDLANNCKILIDAPKVIDLNLTETLFARMNILT